MINRTISELGPGAAISGEGRHAIAQETAPVVLFPKAGAGHCGRGASCGPGKEVGFHF